SENGFIFSFPLIMILTILGGYTMPCFRKTLLFVATMIFLIAALAACGNANEPAPANAGNTPAPSGSADEPTTPATRVYTAADGDVEIPAEPQRIVVVSRAYLGHLLALDVRPVGAPSDALDNPFLAGLVDGIDDIGA